MKNNNLSAFFVALATILTTCIACQDEGIDEPNPEILGCLASPFSLELFTPNPPRIIVLQSGNVETTDVTQKLNQVVVSGVLPKELQGLSDSLSMYLTMDSQTLAEKIKLISVGGNTPTDVKVQLDKLVNHPTIIKYLTTLTLPKVNGEVVKAARVGTVTEVIQIDTTLSECQETHLKAYNVGKQQIENAYKNNLDVVNTQNASIAKFISERSCESTSKQKIDNAKSILQDEYTTFLKSVSTLKKQDTNLVQILRFLVYNDAFEKVAILGKAELKACDLQTTKMIEAAQEAHQLNVSNVENRYKTGLNDLAENYNKAVSNCK